MRIWTILFLTGLVTMTGACIHIHGTASLRYSEVRRPLTYGAVETDIFPSEALVVVNGTELGAVNDFDGFPDYLYLETGTHQLEIRCPGYRSLHYQLQIVPRSAIRISARMIPGADQAETIESPNPDTGTIKLTVLPESAAVYINGSFAGTGKDFRRLHAPLQFKSGQVIIEVVDPGYQQTIKDVELKPGEYLELEIVLEEM